MGAIQRAGLTQAAPTDGAIFQGPLYLSGLGRQVQVVHRRDALRAFKIMQERALKNPKIEFVWDTAVEDVLDTAQGKMTAVRLRNLETGAQWETPVDGLFVAIGHQPNTAVFKGRSRSEERRVGKECRL